MIRNLATASLAALMALTLAGCPDDPNDPVIDAGVDAGPVVKPDGGPGPTPTCSPACKAGQKCDTESDPPLCIEICNYPYGCKAGVESCNVETKQCEPLSCGGTKCEYGQGCYDPSTGAPGSDCTCLPERETTSGKVLPDTCAPYGKVCDFGWDGTVAKCVLPGEIEDCKKDVGCQEGLQCKDSVFGGPVCLRPCESTMDCTDTTSYCLKDESYGAPHKNTCFPNFCATPSWVDEADYGTEAEYLAAVAAERANYFKPCPSAGAADGTCIPFNGGTTDIGLCMQAGSAPSNGACDPDADRSNMEGMCPFNEMCSGLQPSEDGTSQVGICKTLCNAGPQADPVATCGDGTDGRSCLDVTGIDYNYGEDVQVEARIGFCMQGCQMFGAERCAADGLGNPQSCWPDDFEGAGYCTAIQPDAAAAGAPCAPTHELDSRQDCVDGAFCNSRTGKCQTWCDKAGCAVTDGACACTETQTCGDTPYSDIPATAKLGACQ